MARIGYGFEDDPEQFKDCHAVYIDTPKTERAHRREAFSDGALRPGDTLVVLRRSALGKGFDFQKWKRLLDERGVALSVEPAGGAPKRTGPDPAFQPDADLEAAMRPLYHDPLYTLAYVQRRIREMYGQDVDRHQLFRAWGPRSGSPAQR